MNAMALIVGWAWKNTVTAMADAGARTDVIGDEARAAVYAAVILAVAAVCAFAYHALLNMERV